MRFEGREVHIRRCYTLLHWQKFTGSNSGDQKVNFGLQNVLNLTYICNFKIFPAVIPRTPVKRGREGRRGKGGAWRGGREEQGIRGEREGIEGYERNRRRGG
jgi:hypothetical protein